MGDIGLASQHPPIDHWRKLHETARGPGDRRPTADDIIVAEHLEGKWTDKVILITGVSSGIGTTSLRALHKTGATIYGAVRDIKKAQKVLGKLLDDPKIKLLELDLSCLDSVRACASAFLAQQSKLNIFMANAGILGVPEGRTKDGFEVHFVTNHLGHFLLFQLLQPALTAASTPEFHSRVVITSSLAHRFTSVNFDNITLKGEYDANTGYAQSKIANVWTANAIERKFGDSANPIHAWSLQPGGVKTALARNMRLKDMLAMLRTPFPMKRLKSAAQGASTQVWAACAQVLEGKGGKYLEDCQIIGPWDPAGGKWSPGYAPYAYDTESEEKLWEMSLKMVGLT